LGGEKLYRFHKFIAAFVISASFFIGSLTVVSAQTPDAAEPSSAAEAVPANPPNPESLIVFGNPSDGEAVAAPGGPSAFTALRMVLVLALAAAAVYGVVFFFKRLSKPQAPANPYLKVLARAPVSAGNSVAVVSVGTKAWLVGAGDSGGGVALIAELADQETVDALLLEDSRGGPDGGASKIVNFSALLRRLGGGNGGSRIGAESLGKRRERLNKL
jgi:flagellar protein FliO/FliZ